MGMEKYKATIQYSLNLIMEGFLIKPSLNWSSGAIWGSLKGECESLVPAPSTPPEFGAAKSKAKQASLFYTALNQVTREFNKFEKLF